MRLDQFHRLVEDAGWRSLSPDFQTSTKPGGGFNYFFGHFHPFNWGLHDFHVMSTFFQMDWLKPPTGTPIWGESPKKPSLPKEGLEEATRDSKTDSGAARNLTFCYLGTCFFLR